MDPTNEFSALSEAKQMIAIADESQNHCLEPEEVLECSELFTGSNWWTTPAAGTRSSEPPPRPPQRPLAGCPHSDSSGIAASRF